MFVERYVNKFQIEKKDGGDPAIDLCVRLYS
jgi:hypothetical protein